MGEVDRHTLTTNPFLGGFSHALFWFGLGLVCNRRCVVSRKGVAIDMSTDHKPEDESELTRIEKAGGAVVDGRVQVKCCSFPLIH